MFFTWKHFLGKAKNQTRKTQRAAPVKERFIPRVERLEDRWTPSTFQVTNSFDDGNVGSLRWAIDQVNAAPSASGDTIDFAANLIGGQTITLNSSLPTIANASSNLTITDLGSAAVTVSNGVNAYGSVFTSNRNLVLDDLTVSSEAISAVGYSVTLFNCRFTGGVATAGGIISASNVTASNCSFTGGVATASGGAIYVGEGSVVVTNCSFSSDGTADSSATKGGAIYGGNITAANCTFLSDYATVGGAIYSAAGGVQATNCTFTSDGSGDSGGAIYSSTTATVTDCAFAADGTLSYFNNYNLEPYTSTVQAHGGAISAVSVTANGCTFDANGGSLRANGRGVSGSIYTARMSGGAIYASGRGPFPKRG